MVRVGERASSVGGRKHGTWHVGVDVRAAARRGAVGADAEAEGARQNGSQVQGLPFNGLVLTSMARQNPADSRLPLARSNVPHSSGQ